MTKDDTDSVPIADQPSVLGKQWCSMYESPLDAEASHFEDAMLNVIREPNINSTVILRADILRKEENLPDGLKSFTSDLCDPKIEEAGILHRNLQDIEFRKVPLEEGFSPKLRIVRRIIPRNPFKDYIINQTCLMLESKKDNSILVVYIPHIEREEEVPFYLPPVNAVGILYCANKISLHYLAMKYQDPQVVERLRNMDLSERPVRIAYRLLQTAKKHSKGVKNGYQKRVNLDLIVSKVAFQNRYISLKNKYSLKLVESWCESTDPRKHVFEDLAIAAFLIEYWNKVYKSCDFEFRDLGCGNGLLVYILTMEGYNGMGIDARARKSWLKYPENVQSKLKEQVIIPSVLLRPHPSIKQQHPHLNDNGRVFQVPLPAKDKQMLSSLDDDVPVMAYYSSAKLLSSNQVNTAEFPENTFIIGNHSDELTCWIPLLGHPFLVIPCCSHALSGDRKRFTSRKNVSTNGKPQPVSYSSNSAYAGLVSHVREIAEWAGWRVEQEMLRIPSTRNAAIIGQERSSPHRNLYDIILSEGGAEGWVENTMLLMKSGPRNH